MNSFDLTIIHFLNEYAGRSPAFDSSLEFMSRNALLEGGIIVALFWWAWAQAGGKTSKEREFLLFGLFASAFAVLVGRTLALAFPFRVRPLQNPLLGFKPPDSIDRNIFMGWSSFPSDHAVVFFCLATGLCLVSTRLGAVALAYALLGSSFPRVYLGIHYPTDVLAGAALGIGIAFLAKVNWLRNGLLHPFLYWQENHPGSFTAFLFLFSFEVAEEFNTLRIVGLSAYHVVRYGVQTIR
jgi:undecaprenyl-diphosphatase